MSKALFAARQSLRPALLKATFGRETRQRYDLLEAIT
jgi:hypothetical protein